jgi:hypothetical protein
LQLTTFSSRPELVETKCEFGCLNPEHFWNGGEDTLEWLCEDLVDDTNGFEL